MAQGFKSNISFTKRSVFVSLIAGGRASTVGPRIRKRLSLAQPRVIEVIERKPGESRLEFLQRLEEVADLILLVDDELCAQLNLAPFEALPAQLEEGQELVIALLRNEKAAVPGMQRIRIWLAMVDALDLKALSNVANGRWDLTCDELNRRLHWLYEPDDRVTWESPDNGMLREADDARLGERIRLFRDHALPACERCSEDPNATAAQT